MVIATSADRKESTAQHLTALRDYATRILVNGDILTPREEEDRDLRMHQYLETLTSYRCTEKEAVSQLYRGFFPVGHGALMPGRVPSHPTPTKAPLGPPRAGPPAPGRASS